MFPEKVDIYYIKDKYTKNWGSIDFGLNELIKKCKSEWIFEIQGDEILDPINAKKMVKVIKESARRGSETNLVNAIRHSRLDYNFTNEEFCYDMRTIRVVRNIPNLTSYIGGDNFQVGPQSRARGGFTLHNVPPERDDYSFVLKHYIRCFPACFQEWTRRHAVDLASDNDNRISIFNDRTKMPPPNGSKRSIPSHVPFILKDLIGSDFYEVRPCLFDLDWLQERTGINYNSNI